MFVFTKSGPFPKIIFQTWKTYTPPAKMAYWAQTWKDNNPDYKYVLWDDADNRKFVEEHYKWFLPTYDGYDVEIKRADAIRYMFLHKYGGIYADMDFECLKPFDTLLETYSGYDIILGKMESGSDANEWHSSNNIPNAIMISKAGLSFWIQVLKRMIEKAGKGRPEVETGPIVLKEVYSSAYFDKIKLLDSSALYPISWVTAEAERVECLKTAPADLTASMKSKYPSAFAVTYWAHSW